MFAGPRVIESLTQVYTSSYDGTVRCWDTEHSQFLETAVFADHAMLSYADMLWDKSTIVGCHSDGSKWEKYLPVSNQDVKMGMRPHVPSQQDEDAMNYFGLIANLSVADSKPGSNPTAATLTDIRAGKTPQHTAQLHERKISHVHINPVDNNL